MLRRLLPSSPRARAFRHDRRAVSAVEFALIFPLVFAIVYGGICYGYIYFLQQRINFIAQEAVRAAIAVAPGDDAGAYLAAAQNLGNIAIANNFSAAGVPVREVWDPVTDPALDPDADLPADRAAVPLSASVTRPDE